MKRLLFGLIFVMICFPALAGHPPATPPKKPDLCAPTSQLRGAMYFITDQPYRMSVWTGGDRFLLVLEGKDFSCIAGTGKAMFVPRKVGI